MLCPRADGRSGFTLLEVVVALAVAGLSLALLLGATSQGLDNAQTADRYLDATRRAQSHLAEIGVTIPLKPGDLSGDDGDGFTWRIRVSEPQLHTPLPGKRVEKPVGIYTIEATVAWKAGSLSREVRLQSRRLGAS